MNKFEQIWNNVENCEIFMKRPAAQSRVSFLASSSKQSPSLHSPGPQQRKSPPTQEKQATGLQNFSTPPSWNADLGRPTQLEKFAFAVVLKRPRWFFSPTLQAAALNKRKEDNFEESFGLGWLAGCICICICCSLEIPGRVAFPPQIPCLHNW